MLVCVCVCVYKQGRLDEIRKYKEYVELGHDIKAILVIENECNSCTNAK